jgi:hypothetical protein
MIASMEFAYLFVCKRIECPEVHALPGLGSDGNAVAAQRARAGSSCEFMTLSSRCGITAGHRKSTSL